jgi:hypothetical protein
MAREDIFREWNALQELYVRLPNLLEKNNAEVYETRLDLLLKPEEAAANLNRTVLRAWRALEDSPELIQMLRSLLGYKEGFLLESLPGPEIPIHPGPLYCCPTPSCKRSLFQLFDGQTLTCPVHKISMVIYQNVPRKM